MRMPRTLSTTSPRSRTVVCRLRTSSPVPLERHHDRDDVGVDLGEQQRQLVDGVHQRVDLVAAETVGEAPDRAGQPAEDVDQLVGQRFDLFDDPLDPRRHRVHPTGHPGRVADQAGDALELRADLVDERLDLADDSCDLGVDP